MKTAFFEVEKWEQELIRSNLPKDQILFFSDSLSSRNISKIRDCECVCAFIYSHFDKAVLDKLPKLKLICTMSTGFDHIDIEECKRRGIRVCNVPTYGENTVAEHTFALILTLSRKIFHSIERTHIEGNFETDESLRGFDLKDRTIGLIGCGNIGLHVARMAKGFEMKVLVFDLKPDKKLAEKIGFRYVSMDVLLKNSDIISLHVPYNSHTHHMIDKNMIAKMKDGVFIINTARGGLMNTKDLVNSLKSGKVAGAGLDVLEEECEVMEESAVLKDKFKQTCDLQTMLANHILMKMDNVVITPHNAFNSREALERIVCTTIDNVKGFESGRVRNSVL